MSLKLFLCSTCMMDLAVWVTRYLTCIPRHLWHHPCSDVLLEFADFTFLESMPPQHLAITDYLSSWSCPAVGGPGSMYSISSLRYCLENVSATTDDQDYSCLFSFLNKHFNKNFRPTFSAWNRQIWSLGIPYWIIKNVSSSKNPELVFWSVPRQSSSFLCLHVRLYTETLSIIRWSEEESWPRAGWGPLTLGST